MRSVAASFTLGSSNVGKSDSMDSYYGQRKSQLASSSRKGSSNALVVKTTAGMLSTGQGASSLSPSVSNKLGSTFPVSSAMSNSGKLRVAATAPPTPVNPFLSNAGDAKSSFPSFASSDSAAGRTAPVKSLFMPAESSSSTSSTAAAGAASPVGSQSPVPMQMAAQPSRSTSMNDDLMQMSMQRSNSGIPPSLGARPRTQSASKSVRFSSELVTYEKARTLDCSNGIVSVLKGSSSKDLLSMGGSSSPKTVPGAAGGGGGGAVGSAAAGAAGAGIAYTGSSSSSSDSAVLPRNVASSPAAPAPKRLLLGRPSLTEQLAAIGASAQALTQDIRAKAGIDNGMDQEAPILSLPAKCFTVGTLNCRYPSPVRFFQDRCEYTFHHPFENSEIRMVMFYRDMGGTTIAGSKIRFKVNRRLVHFPDDFDPTNPQHQITVELTSVVASSSVRQKIMPLICPITFGAPK